MTTRFVCLAGLSRSGKDEVARVLVREHGFTRVAIADRLKEVVMHVFGLGAAQLWAEERDTRDPVLKLTPRELYQRFGDACRDLDPEVWIRPWRTRVETLRARGSSVVCSDLRTGEEARTARLMGGEFWLVRRPGAGAPGPAALHATEQELTVPDALAFDAIVENEGSLVDLALRVTRVHDNRGGLQSSAIAQPSTTTSTGSKLASPPRWGSGSMPLSSPLASTCSPPPRHQAGWFRPCR